MKIKVATNDENYKGVVLKRAIILCWIALAICFVIKLFGGNFFNIICNNKKFIQVCEFVDNSIIYYIIGYLSFVISSSMVYFCVNTKFEKKFYLFLVILSLYWIVKLLINIGIIEINTLLYNIVDFCSFYVILILFTKRYLYSFVAYGLMLLFSIISSLTKNIGIHNSIDENTLTALIFMIDYYIMLGLYLLYTIFKKSKKEVS